MDPSPSNFSSAPAVWQYLHLHFLFLGSYLPSVKRSVCFQLLPRCFSREYPLINYICCIRVTIRKAQMPLQSNSSFIQSILIQMNIHKLMPVDQNSDQMQELADKNGTTYGICGFITCALSEYLANSTQFKPEMLAKIKAQTLTPYIDKAMKAILARRRLELKKFYKLMSDGDRKKYLKNWVASYEIADYLQDRIQGFKNKQVFFFRQCAYDHPLELAQVELQQKERVAQEEPFKGQRFFYSSFGPYANHFKEQFEAVLRQADPTLPVIIATDIFQHFYTVVLFQGQVYILDSLSSFLEVRHDSEIVECIEYLYKQSYLIKKP